MGQQPFPALRYEPEAFHLSGSRIMGRQSAGETFLRALVNAADGRQLTGFGPQERSGVAFKTALGQINPAVKAVWLRSDDLIAFSRIGALHFPDPSLAEQARIRVRAGTGAYGLTGITHTISSANAMRMLADITMAPIMPWDGLICTSRAVKSSVEQIFSVQEDYARWKFGTQGRLLRPEMPIIPLGVHTADFAFSSMEQKQARSQLGISEDEVVFLFLGRLSYHAKAHPYQMYRALEDVARATGKRITLIQCGWFANEFIERAFKDGATKFSPSVKHVWLDGRQQIERNKAWSASDIFLSLSDNIQETFGLTILEAMAAGLPVIASDWDGYRDIVVSGQTGFLVPTLMPEPAVGDELSLGLVAGTLDYDRYIGLCSQMVSVNQQELRNSIRALVTQQELRKSMGAAGRAHAISHFEWSGLLRRYEEFWAMLEGRRLKANSERQPQLRGGMADQLAPFRMFSGYGSERISSQSEVRLVNRSLVVKHLLGDDFFVLASGLFLNGAEEILTILSSLSEEAPLRVDAIEKHLGLRPAIVRKALAVLAKMELVEIIPPQIVTKSTP
jgi:starch synthase